MTTTAVETEKTEDRIFGRRRCRPIIAPTLPSRLHLRLTESNSSTAGTGSKSRNVKGTDVDAIVNQEAIYEELLGDFDYEIDDLCCFRGLVLDTLYSDVLLFNRWTYDDIQLPKPSIATS